MAKNFALIGAAGFIAPRHMQAIKATGNQLVAAFDVNDSVGILDSHFPECRFFTDYEDFAKFMVQQKKIQPIEYVSICSPNYLHLPHIQMALSHGAHAICEKPLALTMRDIDELRRAEMTFDRRVFTVLQLRLHDAIAALKARIERQPRAQHSINLTYVTSRGDWYLQSWKGDTNRSGGLSTNIGVHFFDMLTWIFGKALNMGISERGVRHERGFLQLERARVNWFLSIDRNHLPPAANGKATFRSIEIDGEKFEFSEGFTDLHNRVYQDILGGGGYGLNDTESIRIVEYLRNFQPNSVAEVAQP